MTSGADVTSASAAIAVLSSASTAASDSVYIVQRCARDSKRDSIAEASLPSAISTYLSSDYAGYTFYKAFAIEDRTGATTGYVAIIYYNDKPVGLEFDSTGNFVRVLEQRDKGDLEGPGWLHGGHFHDRDGLQKDTVALASLPAAIQTYLAQNYAGDTLVKTFVSHDSTYVVLSKDNGVFANLFSSTGNFIERVQLPSRPGAFQPVDAAALPGAITTYLNTTYPNYVFKKAFAVTANGTVAGYVVLIDANSTKYAVAFDAAGNYLRTKIIY